MILSHLGLHRSLDQIFLLFFLFVRVFVEISGLSRQIFQLVPRVGIRELCAGVSREHVDDDYLAPLLNVNQEVAELTKVLVDELDTLGTDLKEEEAKRYFSRVNESRDKVNFFLVRTRKYLFKRHDGATHDEGGSIAQQLLNLSLIHI